ncbi:MAG: glycosyltransferase family 1 protein [Bacteroidaceae bacterium]|jgi:glycosyltransferase involved in cell wall biosynthesis|nr:glycosyltransferase family 1 protein [Bacteroidaceae bacterium]
MRILLLGEYSNVHWTLAEGLRTMGHEVTVASDGDYWKDYRRDIDLKRKSLGKVDTATFLLRLAWLFPQFRGYDVVQIINPVFLDLSAEKMYPFYRYLRQHNKKVFMGAFGMDYYWVKAGLDCKTFRYSDFNMGSELRHNADNDIYIADWYEGEKGKLTQYVANDCDGIISGLYEYDAAYRPYFANKLRFIPFPINMNAVSPLQPDGHKKVRFFIGVQKTRSEYKGTDIMLRALERVVNEYPEHCEMMKAESVPFEQYQLMMNTSDVLLDQLYSYTPAMNALLAMAKGLVVVGGGEPENYDILHEEELHPIINVLPNEEDVYEKLRWVALHSDRIPELSRQSIEYIRRHHDHVKVAREYLDFWRAND